MELAASKVKSFTDLKLGINIPARGESSDLLNADGDKNDYEWLVFFFVFLFELSIAGNCFFLCNGVIIILPI